MNSLSNSFCLPGCLHKCTVCECVKVCVCVCVCTRVCMPPPPPLSLSLSLSLLIKSIKHSVNPSPFLPHLFILASVRPVESSHPSPLSTKMGQYWQKQFKVFTYWVNHHCEKWVATNDITVCAVPCEALANLYIMLAGKFCDMFTHISRKPFQALWWQQALTNHYYHHFPKTTLTLNINLSQTITASASSLQLSIIITITTIIIIIFLHLPT